MTNGLSDRVAGAVLLALAVAFWVAAGQYAVTFGDPVGPAAFPKLVAVPLGLFSLYLIFRPDPDPRWFVWPGVVGQAATLAVLVLYPLLLEPLGFPLATALASAVLARVLGAAWLAALVLGVAVGGGLFLVFDSVLGLPLPLAPSFSF
ncbi:tripartite tricarboxylate transporter TctB family protein [Propylenella binzhouense]|uniref:tripartite tricarboxylate transporter TctB family protein n=1 Tax=Propylenella binzhouense TaxID=2555902 RepID=UPI00196839C6